MKVEKDIAIPVGSAKGAPAKYPFSKMEVGDSVFFENGKTGGKEYLAAQALGRYKKWKFSGREQDGGVRIWRID